jgi:hypothetical protein
MKQSFKIHGYDFADRLLEDCYFDVLVEITENSASKVISINPDSDSAPYCKNVKWKIHATAMGETVINDLTHLQAHATSNGRTILEEFEDFEREVGQDREWILTEV